MDAHLRPAQPARQKEWMAGAGRLSRAGFSLIELMIVVAIIAVLASIAYPSYTSHIVKSKRVAGEGCLSEYASYMEHWYTSNLRYDKDSSGKGIADSWPTLECSTHTAQEYEYELSAVDRMTYTLTATPVGMQALRDTRCGTLTLEQDGTRSISGTGSLEDCW